jgi:hypothetical protein
MFPVKRFGFAGFMLAFSKLLAIALSFGQAHAEGMGVRGAGLGRGGLSCAAAMAAQRVNGPKPMAIDRRRSFRMGDRPVAR